MFGGPPFGQRIGGNVNLSTGSSSSFASLLDNVRAERQQREEKERVDKAVRVLQRKWRAGREGRRVRAGLIRGRIPAEEDYGRDENMSEESDEEGQGDPVAQGMDGSGPLRGLVRRVVLSAKWAGVEEGRQRGEWARRALIEGARSGTPSHPIPPTELRSRAS